MVRDDWDQLTDEQKHQTQVKLPMIPQYNKVRFRNTCDMLRIFVVWTYELQMIADTPGDPYQEEAQESLLSTDDQDFVAAMHKVASHNITYIKHFEQQSQYQVCKTEIFTKKTEIFCSLALQSTFT